MADLAMEVRVEQAEKVVVLEAPGLRAEGWALEVVAEMMAGLVAETAGAEMVGGLEGAMVAEVAVVGLEAAMEEEVKVVDVWVGVDLVAVAMVAAVTDWVAWRVEGLEAVKVVVEVMAGLVVETAGAATVGGSEEVMVVGVTVVGLEDSMEEEVQLVKVRVAVETAVGREAGAMVGMVVGALFSDTMNTMFHRWHSIGCLLCLLCTSHTHVDPTPRIRQRCMKCWRHISEHNSQSTEGSYAGYCRRNAIPCQRHPDCAMSARIPTDKLSTVVQAAKTVPT